MCGPNNGAQNKLLTLTNKIVASHSANSCLVVSPRTLWFNTRLVVITSRLEAIATRLESYLKQTKPCGPAEPRVQPGALLCPWIFRQPSAAALQPSPLPTQHGSGAVLAQQCLQGRHSPAPTTSRSNAPNTPKVCSTKNPARAMRRNTSSLKLPRFPAGK